MLPPFLLAWDALGKVGAKIDLKRCKVNRAIRKFIISEENGACIVHDKISMFTKPVYSGMMGPMYQKGETRFFLYNI